MAYDYDLFTIGAGSGGTRASRLAAMSGARVAVAEEFRVGGTCVIRGCVPKKLLVYASNYGRQFKDAEGFGWTTQGVEFDWTTLRDNVAAEVDRLSAIYTRNLRNAGVEILQDRAEIVDPHTVRLVRADRTVTAERILLACGGAPYRPLELEGQEHAITSNEAFHLPRLPKHVIIAGGGYIAVEFATIFAGLGVKTCLLYRGETVLRGFDEDIRTHVHSTMARAGVRIITEQVFTKIDKRGPDDFVATLSGGDQIETDLIMFAIGRDPLTAGLGLENAGVALDPKGAVIVDAYGQTSTPSIYAVGDITNRVNLTPVAIREGHAFAETVYYNCPTQVDHTDIPTAVFCRPEVGCVGMTEAQARAKHRRVDIYKSLFWPMKHILARNEERMLMKLVVDAESGVVLGVHLAGPEAPEMAQLAGIAVKAKLTKAQWDATIALHPTAAEELVLMREKFVPQELKAVG